MLSGPEQGPLFEIPEFDGAIPTGGGQRPFVRAKSQRKGYPCGPARPDVRGALLAPDPHFPCRLPAAQY